MRRNIYALDESIETVREAPQGEKPEDKRARLKLLRDLIELQNSTLTNVKTHLLGRDPTGVLIEPPDKWEDNTQIEFERYFKNQFSLRDLKLKCVECGVKSEDVSTYHFPPKYYGKYFEKVKPAEDHDLCSKCYEKRNTEKTDEDQISPILEGSNHDARTS
jgi:hypothetical protein